MKTSGSLGRELRWGSKGSVQSLTVSNVLRDLGHPSVSWLT